MSSTSTRVQIIDSRTLSAYSRDRYRSWNSCIRLLIDRGYTDNECVAILCSKWMRWASDNKKSLHGPATSMDLERWMDDPRNECTPGTIDSLVDQTI